MTLAARTIDGVTPREVVSAQSAEELAAALRAADEAGHAVAAVGGGTQLDLGMPPSRLDVVIETTGLNNVVEYEPADLTVTVEAGMRFGELQRMLGEQGQMLALDPPVEDGATLGGVIATNVSGPLRFAYGTARDLVIGTRVANPDGTITHAGGRVVKNVAGYDLNKLYIGSLGTLAIVVELSFKLAPIPPATATVSGEFEGAQQVRELVAAVVRSPLSPLAIELIGSRQVVFRVGGYPQAVERQVRDLSALITDGGGRLTETAWEDLQRQRLEARRRDVLLKATAPISQSATLVEILERNLSALAPQVWAHAGNGIAYAACEAPSDASVVQTTRMEVCALGANA
ncbi:MAG: FAD-binding oxidoreductase, partial [Chloroflexi bacterium]|nr:FAD-binding oxidoreductase [Chloroflexota bacterium]